MPRGERMLASGLVCIDLLNGVMSREQHQLVRPSPAAKAAGEGIKTIAPPNYTWALFLRNFVNTQGLFSRLSFPVTWM